MIWVIGDSHADVFNGNVNINGPKYGDSLDCLLRYKEKFVGMNLGAFTAYNAFSKKQFIQSHLDSFNKNIDYLFLSFGEIDCRCHLGFHSDNKKISYDSVVADCVRRYFSLLTFFQSEGFNVGAWGVIASGLYDGIQGNGALSYKTSLDRNNITRLFNAQLEYLCKHSNMKFKSIFNKICDSNLNTKPDCHFDNIHIACNKTSQFIIEEFQDLL